MADEHSERYPCDEEAALGAPSTGEGAHEMAQPVIPVPEVEAPGATTGTKGSLMLRRRSKRQSSSSFGWTAQARQSFLIASWFGLKTKVV